MNTTATPTAVVALAAPAGQDERARFDAWVTAAGCYGHNGFNRMENMWEAWQAALSAQPSPAMESMGKRKLHQLQGDGFIVNGVAIFNPETGRRGLVDSFGYVGWVTKPSPGGQDALSAQAVGMLPDDARLVGVIADNIERDKLDHPGLYRNTQLAEVLRRVLSAALSAQPSPGGQGAAFAEALQHYMRDESNKLPNEVFKLPQEAQRALVTLSGLAASPMRIHPSDAKEAVEYVIAALLNAARQPVAGLSWANYWMERGQPDVAHDFDAFSRAEAWALQRFPATRQPVGQLTDAEIDARLNTLYRAMVASGQHNGGMSGVAWDRAVYRMASSQLSGKSGDLAFDTQPVGRQSIATCPRDGTVVLLHWGEDHVSPGWWTAPASPVQNDDGTWPSDTGGFPWAFIDINGGSAFVNRAVDTEYGPTHWSLYATPTARAVDLAQLLPAVRMLVVSARTSGGTSGRDAHLCEALDRVDALLPPIDGQAVCK
ncbi:hypothetical protein JY471_03700 [Stenotrophomonas maltophilia]|nr:hypothetical protein [Stenotrophomonas maltophilia]